MKSDATPGPQVGNSTASEALRRFADSDDPAALKDLLRRWGEKVERERASARITPAADAWEALRGSLSCNV
jgi:hypothetical protein